MRHRTVLGATAACTLAVVAVVGVARLGVDETSVVTAADGVVALQERPKVEAAAETAAEIASLPPPDAALPAPAPPPVGRLTDLADAVTGARPERTVLAGSPERTVVAGASPPAAAAPQLTLGALYDDPAASGPRPPDYPLVAPPAPRYRAAAPNELRLVAEAPVSTFSIDVDTASYAQVRRMLSQGVLPAPADVRVEELINYFSYDYPLPEADGAPFRASVAVYPTPWNADTRLLHIGLKGRELAPASRPRANLVFLIDTSGSMAAPDRLPLLKTALRMLVDALDEDDTVAIVTYAGEAGTVLEPTPASDRRRILAAIDRLRAEGSTAGAAGLAEAYALAGSAFDEGGVNRVILATDGDFNVGLSDPAALEAYIAGKRKSGVFLSVLGFGTGNYNDPVMQALAQSGNGHAAYIDTLKEAEKVLVGEATAMLFPIAKDVKVQVEFNPANVAAWRLVGYETRMLRRQDFNNHRIDAGEIGAGHTVTALYEIVPAAGAHLVIDDLRYIGPPEPAALVNRDEYALLKLRYKAPDSERSELIEIPVTRDVEKASVEAADDDMRFAAAVAAFGQKLRGEVDLEDYSYAEIGALAAGARGRDPFGLRAELVELVRLAGYLSPAAETSSGNR